jgi:ABC-type phosphate transport system auxiliary subunit
MADEHSGDTIAEAIPSAVGVAGWLVVGLLVLAFVIGWTYFWIAAVQIHYAQGDPISVLFTGAIGAAPAAGVLVRMLPKTGLKARAGDAMDGAITS